MNYTEVYSVHSKYFSLIKKKIYFKYITNTLILYTFKIDHNNIVLEKVLLVDTLFRFLQIHVRRMRYL